MEEIKNIAVIYGGSSSERDVSLQSGEGVFNALNQLGYQAELIDYNDLNNFEILKKNDLVFIALHGFEGEGGKLQSELDSLGISYTGSGQQACKNTWDKHICKTILQQNNINTPSWKLHESLTQYIDMLPSSLNLKNVFLKPCQDGSSVDIFKIKDKKSFIEAIERSLNPNRAFITEECITGKEFTVTIIGDECFPAIEIITGNEFYDYEAKYISDDTGLIEANLTTHELKRINQIAIDAFTALKCTGWARVDLLQDKDGVFYVLEINTVPGMTSHSCVPKSGKFLGLQYNDVVDRIINESL